MTTPEARGGRSFAADPIVAAPGELPPVWAAQLVGCVVDENVGLLAVVGEGMRGTPGLAGRIFTAVSRERINIIAIAQGSSELTIGIIVRRAGLERAVRAVHEECGLGMRAAPEPPRAIHSSDTVSR